MTTPPPSEGSLPSEQIHPALREVYLHSFEVLRKGLNAGDRYPKVWIRDLSTFIEIQSRVVPPDVPRDALLRFFAFQHPGESILDGFTAKGSILDAYNMCLRSATHSPSNRSMTTTEGNSSSHRSRQNSRNQHKTHHEHNPELTF